MDREPDLDEMTAGEWVHYRRRALGFTIEEVAERADITPATVAQVEAGQANDVAERLRAALATRPSALLARHRDRVLEAAARLGIRNVRVFGSVGRGDDRTDSDIDLIVDLPLDGYLLERRFGLGGALAVVGWPPAPGSSDPDRWSPSGARGHGRCRLAWPGRARCARVATER